MTMPNGSVSRKSGHEPPKNGRETLSAVAEMIADIPVPDHTDACLTMISQIIVAMVKTSPVDEAPRMAAFARIMALWGKD